MLQHDPMISSRLCILLLSYLASMKSDVNHFEFQRFTPAPQHFFLEVTFVVNGVSFMNGKNGVISLWVLGLLPQHEQHGLFVIL